MRVLQVLVPQVEKICMDRGLTDESEIIKFLQHWNTCWSFTGPTSNINTEISTKFWYSYVVSNIYVGCYLS